MTSQPRRLRASAYALLPMFFALSACLPDVDIEEGPSADPSGGAVQKGTPHAGASGRGLPDFPTALASPQDPLALALDEANVYWSNADGSVHQASKSGGEPTELSPGVGGPVFAVAVDATRVFWPATAFMKIAEVSKLGGATNVLAENVETLDVAADGANVFFPEHALMTVPAAGGAVSFVLPCAVEPLVLDATSAYAPLPDHATLRKLSKTGGEAVVLAWMDSPITSLAVYEDTVYVATSTGSVFAVPVDGGNPVALSAGLDVARIAVDASGIYATTARTPGPNQVLRIPFDGGEPIILADDQRAPRAIALDDDNVYWTNDGAFTPNALGAFGGSIMRVAKP
jgi:hypothetical protein